MCLSPGYAESYGGHERVPVGKHLSSSCLHVRWLPALLIHMHMCHWRQQVHLYITIYREESIDVVTYEIAQGLVPSLVTSRIDTIWISLPC